MYNELEVNESTYFTIKADYVLLILFQRAQRLEQEK